MSEKRKKKFKDKWIEELGERDGLKKWEEYHKKMV